MGLTSKRLGWLDYYAPEREERERRGKATTGDLFTASLLPGELGRPLWAGNKAELVRRYTEFTYACTSLIADAAAQVPLRAHYIRRPGHPPRGEGKWFQAEPAPLGLRRQLRKRKHLQRYIAPRGELMEIATHPILDLFADANPAMDGYFLSKLTFIFLCLTGESYTWIRMDKGLGVPFELWPLPSQWTRPVIGKGGQIDGYVYGRTQTEEIKYRADEIVYHREPNPMDIIRGYARLTAVATADQLYEQMNQYESALFGNRTEPGGNYVTDQRLTAVQRRELREELESLHRGVKRAGKVGLMDKGLKFQPTQLAPKDMAFLQGRKTTVTELAAGYGVPLSLLRTEDVNKANAEVGETQFARYTIRPLLLLLEQKWNQQLCPMFDKRLFLAHDDPVPEDREAALAERRGYITDGVLTRDEVRVEIGRDPKGGDADRLWAPLNMQPLLEEGEERPAPKPAPKPPGDEEPDDGEETPPEEGKRLKAIEQPKTIRVREEGLRPVREHMMATVLRLWREQRAEVVAAIRAAVPAKAIDPGEVEEWLGEASEWAEKWGDETRAYIESATLRGGSRTMAALPTTLSFNIANPRIAEWLDRETFAFAQEATGETARRLRNTLRAGMDAADTQAQLIKRVDRIFGDRKRAEVIVKTETGWAYEQGGLEGAKQSGVVRAKVWRAHPTACEYCQPYEGKVIELDESFVTVGGRSLPGADGRSLAITYRDVDVAQLHPRCLLPETKVVAPGAAGGYRAWYSGPVVELTLADGARLTVTPNHLLLTPLGFAAAHQLREGDDLVYGFRLQRILSSDPDDDGKPTRIDEVVEALAVADGSTTTTVPVATEHLHGDGHNVEGEIDVVRTDGLGESASVAARHEAGSAIAVEGRGPALAALSRERNLAAMLKALALAADGGVSGERLPAAFFGCQARRAELSCPATSAQFDALALKSQPDRPAVDAERLGDGILRFTRTVADDDGPLVQVHEIAIAGLELGGAQAAGLGDVAQADAGPLEAGTQDGIADALRLCQCLQRFAGEIPTNEIVQVRNRHYSGHVYDLQTSSTLYIAAGAVSSNCECYSEWVLQEEFATAPAGPQPVAAAPGEVAPVQGEPVGQASPWRAAANMDEAKEELTELLDLRASTISAPEGGLQALNESGDELARLYAERPKIKRLARKAGFKKLTLRDVPAGEKASSAGVYGAGEMQLVTRYNGVPEKLLFDADTRFLVARQSTRSVTRHELGHAVGESMAGSKQRAWVRVWQEIDSERSISMYGATNSSEGWAEAFCAYTSPTYQAGMLPAKLEAILKAVLG